MGLRVVSVNRAPRPNLKRRNLPRASDYLIILHRNKRILISHHPDRRSSLLQGSKFGVDPAAFTGVCARRGGLTTAIEAGVPEAVLWMQSGHAQSRAARRYISLNSPALLYETRKAFGP